MQNLTKTQLVVDNTCFWKGPCVWKGPYVYVTIKWQEVTALSSNYLVVMGLNSNAKGS